MSCLTAGQDSLSHSTEDRDKDEQTLECVCVRERERERELTMEGAASVNWSGVRVEVMHWSELLTHLLGSELSRHWDLQEHLFSTVHQPHSGNDPVHSSHDPAVEQVSSG